MSGYEIYLFLIKLFANSGDPDQTPHSAASDLGLHWLPITLLRVSRLQWIKYGTIVNSKDCDQTALLHKLICAYAWQMSWGTMFHAAAYNYVFTEKIIKAYKAPDKISWQQQEDIFFLLFHNMGLSFTIITPDTLSFFLFFLFFF